MTPRHPISATRYSKLEPHGYKFSSLEGYVDIPYPICPRNHVTMDSGRFLMANWLEIRTLYLA